MNRGPVAPRLKALAQRSRMRFYQRILPAWATDFTPAPVLEPRCLEDCRMVTDRDTLIREYLPKRGVVAEVGVAWGDNAHTILEGAEPRELHLIDLDLARLQRDKIEPGLRDGIVRLHENDSAAALASFPDEYFDWIYIDGDHSYPGVKRDIEQAKRAVKPDGLLILNDYIFYSHRELMRYGVIHAVNELCLAEDWAIRYFALHSEMHCDVALARRTD